jgi:hypothetical protein
MRTSGRTSKVSVGLAVVIIDTFPRIFLVECNLCLDLRSGGELVGSVKVANGVAEFQVGEIWCDESAQEVCVNMDPYFIQKRKINLRRGNPTTTRISGGDASFHQCRGE